MKLPISFVLIVISAALPAAAQSKPPAPDQAGCVEAKSLPRLLECRIDNCEKQDGDSREVTVGEENGEELTTTVAGDSRTLRYECPLNTTAASILDRATEALKTNGFEIPYRFANIETALTARKGDMWVTLEAASNYYTLVEIHAAPPDTASMDNAEAMADALERFGHVPIYGITFMIGRADLAPESEPILKEIYTLLDDHPDWRLRIEGHTDNTGTRAVNMLLSFRRASSVEKWLALKGIKKSRLSVDGLGDVQPIADNSTDEGRSRNRRIELVKVSAGHTQ